MFLAKRLLLNKMNANVFAPNVLRNVLLLILQVGQPCILFLQFIKILISVMSRI